MRTGRTLLCAGPASKSSLERFCETAKQGSFVSTFLPSRRSAKEKGRTTRVDDLLERHPQAAKHESENRPANPLDGARVGADVGLVVGGEEGEEDANEEDLDAESDDVLSVNRRSTSGNEGEGKNGKRTGAKMAVATSCLASAAMSSNGNSGTIVESSRVR